MKRRAVAWGLGALVAFGAGSAAVILPRADPAGGGSVALGADGHGVVVQVISARAGLACVEAENAGDGAVDGCHRVNPRLEPSFAPGACLLIAFDRPRDRGDAPPTVVRARDLTRSCRAHSAPAGG